MGFFEKLKQGLSKTASSISSVFTASELDDDFYDDLEESLIVSDLGMDTTETVMDRLRQTVREQHIKTVDEAKIALRAILADMLNVGDSGNWDSFADGEVEGAPTTDEGICPQEVDYNDAKKVCDKLGIPLYRKDFIKEYWDYVFTYFLDELKIKDYKNVLVVAHSGVSKVFDGYFEGIKNGLFLDRGLKNCEIKKYEF